MIGKESRWQQLPLDGRASRKWGKNEKVEFHNKHLYLGGCFRKGGREQVGAAANAFTTNVAAPNAAPPMLLLPNPSTTNVAGLLPPMLLSATGSVKAGNEQTGRKGRKVVNL